MTRRIKSWAPNKTAKQTWENAHHPEAKTMSYFVRPTFQIWKLYNGEKWISNCSHLFLSDSWTDRPLLSSRCSHCEHAVTSQWECWHLQVWLHSYLMVNERKAADPGVEWKKHFPRGDDLGQLKERSLCYVSLVLLRAAHSCLMDF